MYADFEFGIRGRKLLADHGYCLYAAIAERIPQVHSEDVTLGIHPIAGETDWDPNLLVLTPRSRLRIRADASLAPLLLCLSGKKLDVHEHRLHLSVARMMPLVPCEKLRSHLVVIKGSNNAMDMRRAVARQLETMEARASIVIGEKKMMRVGQKSSVGFQVVLLGLSAKDSVRVQEHGVGGRRKMGCGLFDRFG